MLKHKQRKAKSERKLAAMDAHLARVRDVAAEVERQLGPLERKAKRARAYQGLAAELAQKDVVMAVEVGGGVVPIDPAERAAREAAGRLACLLAQRAETVVRVFCGIPTVLKGEETL